ncbi:hypothetical protein [Magnetospirillum moscoviense]|uniref:Tetratricopeptide repeat protein n=1 Tax=Magnetospirillum moscoviense TaxID=1437059 RepID=A0A178MJS2_9PROT|nr:hypothetical protein [Magnetospirillum moscoviense]OAN48849.1 hypothetical protein A6A05_14280 [Magnetospirillum moscoviense]
MWTQSRVLRYQGAIHQGVNAFTDAETAYQGALDAARTGRFRALEGEALISRGDLRRLQGRDDDGRKDLDRALALFDAEGLPREAAAARFRIGSLELERNRPHVAEPILRQVLQAGPVADRLTLAHAHRYLGGIDRDRGDRVAARDHFEAAATTYRSLDSPLGQANVADDLGRLELAAGNAAAAKRWFGDAEILYRRAGDTVWEGKAKAKREEAERALAAGKSVVVAPVPVVAPPPPVPPVVQPPERSLEPAEKPSLSDRLVDALIEELPKIIIGVVVSLLSLLGIWLYSRLKKVVSD